MSSYRGACVCCHAGAVSDFTEAIKLMPTYADGWKRRGQARAALEQHADALEVHALLCPWH